MIEPGKYKGTLQSIEFGVNKNATPTMTTEWLLDCGETRTVYSYFSPKATDNSMKKMKALGFNGDFSNPALSVQETELQCIHKPGDNGPREEWEFTNWGGVQMDAAPPATIAQLNALWKRSNQAGAPPPVSAPKAKDPRTLCWDAFVTTCGDVKAASKDWDRFISTNTTKPEAEITAQEWAQLTKLAEVPFA